MANRPLKPVVFLAFANDREDSIGYLRNLPVEARRLREALEPAERAGLCEIVVRSNSSAGDLFKVFQDPRYRTRVAILHYGGHANGYELLLESASGETAAADAGGLAKFLGQQVGLQLVFLNGCSTQGHTQALLDANIAAVISTSCEIDDNVATDFSTHFYQGLAGGATISGAYHEAQAVILATHQDSIPELHSASGDDASPLPEAACWPWNLCFGNEGRAVDQWTLSKAADDPLFGLPPLPKHPLPKCPYRNLTWFTSADAELFFGRGDPIRELFDALTNQDANSEPVMLFFGQPGVGKSSVLDAGLIPRLQHFCEIRYLRRDERSLLETLRLAFLPDVSDAPIETAWRLKEERIGKPLLVFLDQVEEAYTRPLADCPDELHQLLKVVKATFRETSRRPLGKLVLGFRKEWLAELEAQLDSYQLSPRKVFLEPLDRQGIIEVVQGPAKVQRLVDHYGVTIEDGLAEIIADDLLEDRGSAIAPTLQILLTKMWAEAKNANVAHPEFTKDLYQRLKRKGILLRDFLHQQIAAFRDRDSEVVDSGLLLDIAAMHTTPLGTADQCTLEHLQRHYAHLHAMLPTILQQCQDLQLLTVTASAGQESSKTTRLVHDTLAPLVREQFALSVKPGQRARRILDNRAVDWAHGRTGTPLDEADLRLVEQGVRGTRVWNETEERLVCASRDRRTKLQRHRTWRRVAVVLGVLAITILGAFGWWNFRVAVAKTHESEAALARSHYFVAQARLNGNRISEAQALLRSVPVSQRHFEWHYSRRQFDSDMTLPGHAGSVTSVAFNRDGTRIVSGSADKTLKVWDVDAGRELFCLAGHPGPVNSVCFSPDGKRIVSGSDGATSASRALDTLKVWDAERRQEVATLNGHTQGVKSVDFSPDGRRIVSGSADGSLKVWDAASMRLLKSRFSGHLTVFSVAYSPDGKWIACGCYSGSVLWDGELEQEPIVLPRSAGQVRSVGFRYDGKRIVSGGSYDTFDVSGDLHSGGPAASLQFWDWNAKEATTSKTLPAHTGVVTSVSFSPNDGRIVSGGGDRTVKLWDLDVQREPFILNGHTETVLSVRFSRDGKQIASGSRDGTVRVWNASRSPRTIKTGTSPLDVHFGSRGMLVVSNDHKHAAKVWQVATAQSHISTLIGHADEVTSASCDQIGARIVSGSRDKTVRLWDLSSGRLLHTLEGHDGIVNSVRFSPDGKRIASGGEDNKVIVWDAEHGERLQVLNGHTGPVLDVRFSPNGKHLVSASGTHFVNMTPAAIDNTLKVWDSATGQVLASLSGHNDVVTSACFSPDGRRIVSGSKDKTIAVWDVVRGEKIRELSGHIGPVTCVGFSPDGKRVVSGSDNLYGIDSKLLEQDGTLKVWDPVSGEELLTLSGHKGDVSFVAFSPDGERIVSGSKRDRAIKVWDGSPQPWNDR